MLERLDLDVPLHADRELGSIAYRDRLDGAVVRQGLDGERRRKPVDTLPVEGVDDRLLRAEPGREQPARGEAQAVARGDGVLELDLAVPSVVAAARHLVQPLVQGPPEGDVHLLDPAADPEQRNPPANRAPHQGEAEDVPARVAHILSRGRLLP